MFVTILMLSILNLAAWVVFPISTNCLWFCCIFTLTIKSNLGCCVETATVIVLGSPVNYHQHNLVCGFNQQSK
jgi:hypothetical protein